MLQRLLDTVSLTGAQWVLVIALSLVAPAFTAIDKAIQLHRLNQAPQGRRAQSVPRRRLRRSVDGYSAGERRDPEHRDCTTGTTTATTGG